MKQLAENAEMAERMGEASYLRYQELFSAQAVGERYWALYQDVVTQHRPVSA
jgi:glycosyltransferase involved in cell wall biosynthesis